MHCIPFIHCIPSATVLYCSNKKLVAMPTAEHSTQERHSVGQSRLARCLYLCMGAPLSCPDICTDVGTAPSIPFIFLSPVYPPAHSSHDRARDSASVTWYADMQGMSQRMKCNDDHSLQSQAVCTLHSCCMIICTYMHLLL
jgi:hypothetical protein